MQQIEAWPASQIQTPGPAHFLSEEELRSELGDAIDRRREADARAEAAKVTADKAEALMYATGEKVAYGGHQSRLGRSARFDPENEHATREFAAVQLAW